MRFPPASIWLAFSLSFLAPSLAEACGGTFCDFGTQMSVDQTGEDILFIREGNEVEVHVRIAYTGEASRFAWLVPLQAVPDISVGSEPLFGQLATATVPRWSLSRSFQCSDDAPPPDDGGLSFIPTSDLSGSEPDVVLQTTVGAFDVVVLQGGTAAEVIEFLQANQYLQDPESEPILQEYLDEGFLFAAVKLSSGVGVEAIHPLVFRMPADEFCVPIRLTRIAAEQDMGIRAYFLGSERAVPSNYEHVVLNPLRFPWSEGTPDIEPYVELLTLAVDEAGGKAFATDYAGTSANVSTLDVYRDTWDENAFVDATPITAIDLIAMQGLNTHPLIQPLLLQFIPPPDGIDPQDFWNDIASYADLIDYAAWDAVAFAAALSEQIIEPGFHAVELLDTWPYLTRLHTTMSPVEMTLDPTFHTNPDLPALAPTTQASTMVLCGAEDEVYKIPLGQDEVEVCATYGAPYPIFEGMPAALRIEQMPMSGPPQVVVDNQALALDVLAMNQVGTECADDGGSGGTTTGEEEGGSGLTAGNDESTDPGLDASEAGCGCASTPGEGTWLLALGFVVLFSRALRNERAPRPRPSGRRRP